MTPAQLAETGELAPRRTGLRWWEMTSNVSALWMWLDQRGQRPHDAGYFLAKPWKWGAEWRAMQQDGEGLAELLAASLEYERKAR